MKALTLWRPWPWVILYGPKRIENRPWAPWKNVIGRRIAIHAGKTFDKGGSRYISERLRFGERGGYDPPDLSLYEAEGVVGVVTVDRWIDIPGVEEIPTGQEPWAFGPIGWVLSGPIPLRISVPCKGGLGLWEVPTDVRHQIEAQL